MEAFIARGLPQRNAHHRVGALVALAKERSVRLVDLSDEDIQQVSPDIDASVRAVLSVGGASCILSKLRLEQPRGSRQANTSMAKQIWLDRVNG